MSSSKKTKQIFKRVIGEFTGERLESNYPQRKPKEKKSLTMDVIFGSNSAPEPMNPIVEAMLQTSEGEENSQKQTSTRIDREMEHWRRERERRDSEWREKVQSEMTSRVEKQSDDIPLPSSPSKGPKVQKPGSKKGMEQIRKRN